jgi:predicted ATPase
MVFLQSLKLSGFLSFPPDSEPLALTPLNVLIGPNGSGKSNLIEGIELLRAAPRGLAAAIREGGTAQEWIWKGEPPARSASLDALVRGQQSPDLRYYLTFAAAAQRAEVLDEGIEEQRRRGPRDRDVFFYYRFQRGQPVLYVRNVQSRAGSGAGQPSAPKQGQRVQPRPPRVKRSPFSSGQTRSYPTYTRTLPRRGSLVPDESILSQRKDPDLHPVLTSLGQRFADIQMFRDWTFGRSAPLRQPQRGDLPTDVLLASSDNLSLILNELQHTEVSSAFNKLLARFLPRYKRFSTRIQGNTVQFYLHEAGLNTPVPATRLSDGTIRFMAILALLLSPDPPPLLCMEEPELGLHPDALALLGDLLVEASSRMQLIVTTHSDTLVSALTDHGASILVCEHRGGTVLNRVNPDNLGPWLERYRLGEIWRIGELGGNP